MEGGYTIRHKGAMTISIRCARSLIAIFVVGAGLGLCSCGSSRHGHAGRVTSSDERSQQQSHGRVVAVGTDDNIPQYGSPATGEVKRSITKLINRYYAAAAADDGKTACSLIYSSLAESVAEDYGRPPGPKYARGNTCATVMTKLFRHMPGYPKSFTDTQVGVIRVRRNHGFAVLHAPSMPPNEIFVERERGMWRVGVLMGRKLVVTGR